MDKLEFSKKLEKRTEDFADDILSFCKLVPKNELTREIISQLIRSSSSVGANYIEANEALSKKDFFHRIRICRKESKESRYWLGRLNKLYPDMRVKIDNLIKESTEFILPFSSIVSKSNS
jgi:four helix bundle protein